MSARLCPQCERGFKPKRPHAVCCSDECRYQRWIENQLQSPGQRVKDRSGTRGGNVRDLDQARGLQEESAEKARWTLIVREHIARTLTETGHFHADDIDPLGVPEPHCNIIGSQIASFANRKLMEKTGVERKVAHKAANARKAPVYRITSKGRRELAAGVSAGRLEDRQGESLSRCRENPVASADPGGADAQPPGTPDSQDPGRRPEPVPSACERNGSPEGSLKPPSGEPERLFTPPPLSPFRHQEAA